MCCGDAVDEDKLVLCCALCCINCSCYNACDCAGCSGKVGVCCLNLECCCKLGAPLLCPCGCCGMTCGCDDFALIKGQVHMLCAVCSTAIPCNDEVPIAVTVLGLTLYPKIGCCVVQKDIMER